MTNWAVEFFSEFFYKNRPYVLCRSLKHEAWSPWRKSSWCFSASASLLSQPSPLPRSKAALAASPAGCSVGERLHLWPFQRPLTAPQMGQNKAYRATWKPPTMISRIQRQTGPNRMWKRTLTVTRMMNCCMRQRVQTRRLWSTRPGRTTAPWGDALQMPCWWICQELALWLFSCSTFCLLTPTERGCQWWSATRSQDKWSFTPRELTLSSWTSLRLLKVRNRGSTALTEELCLLTDLQTNHNIISSICVCVTVTLCVSDMSRCRASSGDLQSHQRTNPETFRQLCQRRPPHTLHR